MAGFHCTGNNFGRNIYPSVDEVMQVQYAFKAIGLPISMLTNQRFPEPAHG